MRAERRPYDVVIYTPHLAPLLATNDVGTTGGAETQVRLIGRALAARGLRVCLCTFDHPDATIPATVDGCDVLLRPPYVRRGSLGRVREALSLVRDLVRLDARVYVTRIAGFHVGLVAIAARLRRRRFIYSSAHVGDFTPRMLLQLARDRILHRLGLRLADEIVVQTDEQVQLCRERLRRPATRIRSIVEGADERAGAGEYFLWVGRAVWYKAPLDYVALARAVPEARFVAVSAPGDRGRDQTAAFEEAAAGVANLELLPPRPRRDLLPLLDRAVATVNTSVSEGMSNVVLEGWARGVPALTLRHDPDDLIRERDLGVFADGSWDVFVAGARTLWRERGEDHALRARCRAHVARDYAPEVVGEAWDGVIRGRDRHPAPRTELAVRT